MITKELIKKFSNEIEELTLKRVDIALDTVRYRRHNPTKDCFCCEVCRVIQETKQEIRKVFEDKKVDNTKLNK